MLASARRKAVSRPAPSGREPVLQPSRVTVLDGPFDGCKMEAAATPDCDDCEMELQRCVAGCSGWIDESVAHDDGCVCSQHGEPSSQWQLDYGDTRCRIGRIFGEGETETALYLEQVEPSESLHWIVGGRDSHPPRIKVHNPVRTWFRSLHHPIGHWFNNIRFRGCRSRDRI